jgi:hypothetical protein
LADLPGEYYRPEDAQQDAADLFPDGMVSSMDLDDMPVLPMPEPMSVMNSEREISDTTGVSDIEFVDQLLNAFGDESEGEAPSVAAVDAAFRMEQEQPVAAVVVPVTTAAVASRAAAAVPEITTIHNKNLPDPELMQRLGEALMMLPKDIQEMIVDRLIQAITSPSFFFAAAKRSNIRANTDQSKRRGSRNARRRRRGGGGTGEAAVESCSCTVTRIIGCHATCRGHAGSLVAPLQCPNG